MTDQDTPAGGAQDGGIYYRPFADVLKDIGRGALLADASRAVADVTAAVLEHDKPGTVTVVIKIAPMKDGPHGMLSVSGKCNIARPEIPPSSIMYGDETGLLTRNDPRQLALSDEDAWTTAKETNPA